MDVQFSFQLFLTITTVLIVLSVIIIIFLVLFFLFLFKRHHKNTHSSPKEGEQPGKINFLAYNIMNNGMNNS